MRTLKTPVEYDVVVCGGGPAGTAADRAALQGISADGIDGAELKKEMLKPGPGG